MNISRVFNFFGALFNYLRWRARFNSFGFRSRMKRCDVLTNPHLISIGKKVEIRKGARLEAFDDDNTSTSKIEIGDGTSIHLYFHCGAAESVKIGKNVLMASRIYISDHDHEFDNPDILPVHSKKLISKPVVIGDGAWLGEGCVILKGVTIGERAVVGANAVVTKDVAPYTIVGGVPARVIRKIDRLVDSNV